jgi:glycosyltransferase involved in cell wall biosynthesis
MLGQAKLALRFQIPSQAAHLDQTIRSVLLAADGCGAELEYMVIDGGSTDGSS